ncbi:MAG: mechanosensitive ion channel family protein [Pseudomonadota bacterium]
MDLESQLADLFGRLASNLGLDAQWVAAVSLLVLGLVGWVLVRLILRRLARLAEQTGQPWDDSIIQALRSPLKLAWWLLFLSLSLSLLPALAPVKALGLRVLHASMVLLVPWFLHRLISGVEEQIVDTKLPDGASLDKATVRSTARLLRVSLWLITVLMVLQTFGVSVSGLLAFGGIGGIAVGFAAKDLLANFFGGLGIHMDRPFTVGDWVRSPDRSIEGTVEDIGWRVTRIRTFDKRPLYVPNSVFGQITIENPSRMLNRRIYESFGLRYSDARVVNDVISGIKKMLGEHEAIDSRQTLIVNFESYGPSSLECFLYCFTKTTNWVDYHAIKQDVLLRLLAIVHEHGADIAFPTSTVHLEKTAELVEEGGTGDASTQVDTVK